MASTRTLQAWPWILIILLAGIITWPSAFLHAQLSQEIAPETPTPQTFKIANIIIKGNKNVPDEAIYTKIPYRVGQVFKPQLSSELIRSLYGMGYFKPNIQVSARVLSPEELELCITLEEKDIVDEIVFEGNKSLKREEIEKQLQLPDLRGVEEEELDYLAESIQKIYRAKDYHDAQVSAEIVPGENNRAKIRFLIIEGPRSYIREVHFVGNKCVQSNKLRKLIFTRPEWLFSFLDKSGSYQPEATKHHDPYVIEHFYKSNGFLYARVDDVKVERDPKSPCHFIVTFYITEGEQYMVGSVSAQSNELCSEAEILDRIPITPGDLYSSEAIRQTLEILRQLWGQQGYIFADIDVKFDKIDEERRTVDLQFLSTLGQPVLLNQINIIGHRKTREKVIRRELTLTEGSLITTRAMDDSRANVERLGYFDPRSGVNWKISRLSDSLADLDLMLQEVRTGSIFADIKLGGDGSDFQSPARSIQIGVGAHDTNLFGTGIRYNASAYVSRQDRQIALSLINPWLYDRPIQTGIDLFHRTSTYTDFRHVNEAPREELTGGSASLGFNTSFFGGMNVLFDIGAERIKYKERVIGHPPLEERSQDFTDAFQTAIDRIFQPGDLLWTSAQAVQDYRNNPITPNRGYLWSSVFKVGIPLQTNGFGFIKWDADAHWYTPLINEYDLILHLHGHMGIVQELGKNIVPYRELYHIGGPATVRGFLFGQIGPTIFGDSIGAKKAFWMNAELVFPITRDFNIAGLVFYDGGAGWDTPGASSIDGIKQGLLKNNNFNFRQSVGFGVKIRSPMPMSIAVGFKLDHRKRLSENVSEVHFTGAVDF